MQKETQLKSSLGMKFRLSSLLALLVFLIEVLPDAQPLALAAMPPQQESAPRISEPVEAIIADLESFVPEYMHEQEIPGVGIALIWDGKLVWTKGFGVANVFTRRAITPETVFEVASNSKVVTAYIALRLVDQGVLSLDKPLNAYLPEPWLPPSEYRDSITLRHVLSHSSGLGHSTTSRESLFPPGRGYSYSAIGIQYAQTVIEHVTRQSLEQLARDIVFQPLEMSSSSFVNRPDLTPRTANGHLRAIVPTLLFAVCYVVFLVLVGLVGLVIHRIWKGQWRPSRRFMVGMLVVAFVLSLVPAFVLFGMISSSEFAWLIAFCGLAFTVAFTLLFLAGRRVIVRQVGERPRQRRILTILWSVLILAGLLLLAGNLTNLPVPRWTDAKAEGAASMRATVGDMAAFLIELSDTRYLSSEVAAQSETPQVRLSSDLWWGLGPGIQHSEYGDALWQWGQHIDFQSFMMIYRGLGFGVVVCTNNDLLNPDVALEIAHRALGGKIEPVRRAIHLGFNYREGD